MAIVVRPWAHSSDLAHAWKLFSSTGPEANLDRRRACDIVQVWQTRGRVPHHIISTAALIDAQLHDAMCMHQSQSTRSGRAAALAHSVRSQSAVHAMALLSFITGAADIQQNKEHKISMFDAARSIGLPAQLVELRHVIVHEGVPGLAVLRQATAEALEWLKNEYWAHIVGEEGIDGVLI